MAMMDQASPKTKLPVYGPPAEDEAGAVDDLPDVQGINRRVACASSAQGTAALGVEVLTVEGLDGNLGSEPLNVEPLALSASLGIGRDRAVVVDAPELALV